LSTDSEEEKKPEQSLGQSDMGKQEKTSGQIVKLWDLPKKEFYKIMYGNTSDDKPMPQVPLPVLTEEGKKLYEQETVCAMTWLMALPSSEGPEC